MGNLFAVIATMAPLALAALVVWVLEMLSVPTLTRLAGERGRHVGVVLGVLLQSATVVVMLAGVWHPLRVAGTALTVCGLAWLAEYIGSHTGIPFGRYHYTPRLIPQLGEVPLLVPLAWLMMLPPAWAVADAIVPGASRGVHALIAALAFTAWDLFLDPQMVAWKYWIWEHPSGRKGYFGIPWTNYLGWIAVAFLITWATGPTDLPVRPLLVVYSITWALETFAQGVFWQLPGPALVGGLMMGVAMAWAWR